MSTESENVITQTLTSLQNVIIELAKEVGGLKKENEALKQQANRQLRAARVEEPDSLPIESFAPNTHLVPRKPGSVGNAVITKFTGHSCVIVTDFGNELTLPVSDVLDLYMQAPGPTQDAKNRKELSKCLNDPSFTPPPEAELLARFNRQKHLIENQIALFEHKLRCLSQGD